MLTVCMGLPIVGSAHSYSQSMILMRTVHRKHNHKSPGTENPIRSNRNSFNPKYQYRT